MLLIIFQWHKYGAIKLLKKILMEGDKHLDLAHHKNNVKWAGQKKVVCMYVCMISFAFPSISLQVKKYPQQ